MESSAPQAIIEDDYRLALKLFMNKDFAKSYDLILRLHNTSQRSLQKGNLDDELFVKINALYLTHLGLLINPSGSAGSFHIPRQEKKDLIKKLEQGAFLLAFADVFGSVAEVPLELLYQICLVRFSCRNELNKHDEHFLCRQFGELYDEIDFNNGDDRYLRRLADMYVFNVLPEVGDFDKAYSILQSNRLLDPEWGTKKLDEIREMKKQEKKAKEKQAKEREQKERKRVEQEIEKNNAAKERSSLKYKSLKQIKKEHDRERSSLPTSEKPDNDNVTLAKLGEKIAYTLNLSKGFFQKNSPVILVAILLAFIVTKFLRTRRINIKERLQDTLRMALKITYL